MRRRSAEKEDILDMKKEEPKKEVIKTGTVNCPFLNVRHEPKPNAKLMKIIKKGDVVTIDESFDDKLWYKIDGGYTKKAFIDIN